MRWIAFTIFGGMMLAATAGAVMASTVGWGLPGMLDKPVSIRQDSRRGYRSSGGFIYFGLRSRRHYGGGYRGGK